MNKRGISPLLATLVLILFAAALGIIVINFGRAQIEVAAKCSVNVGMEFVVLNEKEQICFDKENNQLFFIVENGQNIAVDSLRVRVIGARAIYAADIEDSAIEKGSALLKYVDYDAYRYGEVRQVKLTPRIELYNEKILCPEHSLIEEEVRVCEK